VNAPISARFGHLNLIADDWRTLARFYVDLFGCEPVPPERDYSGPDLAAGTGVPDASLKGAHLRLPGHGESGPTLEIYQYGRNEPSLPPAANRRTSHSLSTTCPLRRSASLHRAARRSAKWSPSRRATAGG
jgi:hypothetical protein